MATKYVKIELKERGKKTQTGECMPAAVSVWEKRGWTVVGDSEQEKPASTSSTGTTPSEKENA